MADTDEVITSWRDRVSTLRKPAASISTWLEARSLPAVWRKDYLMIVRPCVALAAQDRYTLRIPDGLSWSDFRGYEDWQNVAVSQTETSLKVIGGCNGRARRAAVLAEDHVAAYRPSGRLHRTLPAVPAKAPPAGPDWLHEIKHDGFRILARRDAAGVRLYTRNGNNFTKRFP